MENITFNNKKITNNNIQYRQTKLLIIIKQDSTNIWVNVVKNQPINQSLPTNKTVSYTLCSITVFSYCITNAT